MCLQHGSRQALGRVSAVAGTDRFGTSAYGIVKAAEELGFSARGVKGTMEGLLQAEGLPLPLIAHIVTDEGALHYVVVQRIRNGVLTLSDPARGIVKWSADEFARRWSGVLIILQPAAD